MKSTAPIIINENTPQFKTWLEGVIKISHDDMRSNFPNLDLPPFRSDIGSRYIRIVRDNSAHAFVDRTNGDVLKPATWKSPAKHARGNIFDEKNGLGSIGPYGPAYLR